jgi:hypothetical protein
MKNKICFVFFSFLFYIFQFVNAELPISPTNLQGVAISSTEVIISWEYQTQEMHEYIIPIPARSSGAITASQFIAKISTWSLRSREEEIYKEITSGNVPSWIRKFVPVFVSTKGPSGLWHYATYWVLPDYLSLGADDDFIRMPMMPQTAQRIANKFGCLLPTREMVNSIFRNSVVKLNPQPMSPTQYDITAPSTFLLHHQKVEEQRAGKPNGVLTVGTKKDVVISNRLVTYPDRVAIYGWHYPDGSYIQPLSTVHSTTYVDYSHGIRLVRSTMTVDGVEKSVFDVLKDPELYPLVSES